MFKQVNIGKKQINTCHFEVNVLEMNKHNRNEEKTMKNNKKHKQLITIYTLIQEITETLCN